MVIIIKYDETSRRKIVSLPCNPRAQVHGSEGCNTKTFIEAGQHLSAEELYARVKKRILASAIKFGIELKVFNASAARIASKVKTADAVAIFTNKVSHRARKEVMNAARSMNVPVHQFHSCGVCTLRDCLHCIAKGGS